MTNKELQKILEKYPNDMEVLVKDRDETCYNIGTIDTDKVDDGRIQSENSNFETCILIGAD